MTPKLKASYIILTRIKNELANAKTSLDYIKEQKIAANNSKSSYKIIHQINTAMYCLIHFSFIRYVAFLDEFTVHFKSNSTIEQSLVTLVKGRCEKYLSTVEDTFGQVKLARNKVLAHGYRTGNRQLTNLEINAFYNRLVNHDGLDPYLKLSESPESIVREIEKEFGELSDEDITLIEVE